MSDQPTPAMMLRIHPEDQNVFLPLCSRLEEEDAAGVNAILKESLSPRDQLESQRVVQEVIKAFTDGRITLPRLFGFAMIANMLTRSFALLFMEKEGLDEEAALERAVDLFGFLDAAGQAASKIWHIPPTAH